MDRSLFGAARRRPELLLAAAITLFVATLALTAVLSSPADAAPPEGKGGGAVDAVNEVLQRLDALEAEVAQLKAKDAAQDDEIAALKTANTAQDTKISALETANTDLADRLGTAEGRIDDLDSLVSEFEEIVEELDEAVGVLEDLVDGLLGAVDLSADVEALQATFDGVTRNGDTLTFSGMNVKVVNGTGTTDGTPNGKGNLIVGYDNVRLAGNNKSGSHYLVVGDEHDYTRFGGIVSGFSNTASGDWASVSGGPFNTASGKLASVSTGTFNIASGEGASVSGGSGHTASGLLSSVSGGFRNTASGERASVSGGQLNVAGGFLSSILGGNGNTVSTDNGTFPQ